MDIWLVVAFVAVWFLIGLAAARRLYLDGRNDELIIMAVFFGPVVFMVLTIAELFNKIDETRLPPEHQTPGRVIEDFRDRHAPAGDPEHWGSE